MSDAMKILRALRNGDLLTQRDAIERFNCYRLGARVWDIRHGVGINVESVNKKITRADGTIAKIAVYFIRQYADPVKLAELMRHVNPPRRKAREAEPPRPRPQPETVTERQGTLMETCPRP